MESYSFRTYYFDSLDVVTCFSDNKLIIAVVSVMVMRVLVQRCPKYRLLILAMMAISVERMNNILALTFTFCGVKTWVCTSVTVINKHTCTLYKMSIFLLLISQTKQFCVTISG